MKTQQLQKTKEVLPRNNHLLPYGIEISKVKWNKKKEAKIQNENKFSKNIIVV